MGPPPIALEGCENPGYGRKPHVSSRVCVCVCVMTNKKSTKWIATINKTVSSADVHDHPTDLSCCGQPHDVSTMICINIPMFVGWNAYFLVAWNFYVFGKESHFCLQTIHHIPMFLGFEFPCLELCHVTIVVGSSWNPIAVSENEAQNYHNHGMAK